MEDLPKTTLTQRRSEISTGAKKLRPEMLNHNDVLGAPSITDRGSVMKIVAWVMVVVLIGVGSAILVTNFLKDKDSNANKSDTNKTVESTPVANDTDTDTDTNTDTDTTDDTDTDTTDDTDTDTTDDTDTDPGTTPTTSGDIATYDNTDRTRTSSATGNTIILNRFKFYGQGGVFTYIFYNVTTTSGDVDPAASLTYDENNDLTLTLSNISRDNVTGQNNKTSRKIDGLSGLTGTETENTGSKSTYKFLMDKKFKSKLTVDNVTKEIKVEIDLKS